MGIDHSIPMHRAPRNSVSSVSMLMLSRGRGRVCVAGLSRKLTSAVFGTLSQKTSIFRSPKFVCNVTDMVVCGNSVASEIGGGFSRGVGDFSDCFAELMCSCARFDQSCQRLQSPTNVCQFTGPFLGELNQWTPAKQSYFRHWSTSGPHSAHQFQLHSHIINHTLQPVSRRKGGRHRAIRELLCCGMFSRGHPF